MSARWPPAVDALWAIGRNQGFKVQDKAKVGTIRWTIELDNHLLNTRDLD
ncbi:MAG: hypothetical protein AB7F31_03935 [Parachlamydiales bacterium]